MPIYVKDGGTWREISSDAGTQLYVRDSTSFTNKTITNAYVKDGGSWRTTFTLFDTTGYQTTTGSVAVPANANAIHVQYAVGGGSGGVKGAEYDKAGGESAGAGGASGGYISDKVFTVTGGETLTITAGTAGAASTGSAYNTTAGSGSATSITGSSSGSLFSLAGGTGGSGTGGGVQGPLRSNNASVGGAATISGTVLTTGTTVDGLNITTFTSGPVGTFNSNGSGTAGTNPDNCSGDNCQIAGGTGGSSYAGPGAVSGGTGAPAGGSGSAGTRGSGGGGGGAQPQSNGSDGGAGELNYRFMRIA
jgi:hypothetical protein